MSQPNLAISSETESEELQDHTKEESHKKQQRYLEKL